MPSDSASILQMEFDKQPAQTIVRCTGKINSDSWIDFSVTVRGLIPEGKPIRVDLSNVTYIDSVGIGTLVQVWASAKKNELDLKFINPSSRVADVLKITHLFPLFEMQEPGAATASKP